MMNSDGHVFFWGGGFMWIFWVLVIIGIIYLIRAVTKFNTDKSTDENPLEILKKRYARGEIDTEEYELRRRELGG